MTWALGAIRSISVCPCLRARLLCEEMRIAAPSHREPAMTRARDLVHGWRADPRCGGRSLLRSQHGADAGQAQAGRAVLLAKRLGCGTFWVILDEAVPGAAPDSRRACPEKSCTKTVPSRHAPRRETCAVRQGRRTYVSLGVPYSVACRAEAPRATSRLTARSFGGRCRHRSQQDREISRILTALTKRLDIPWIHRNQEDEHSRAVHESFCHRTARTRRARPASC
jgi:hypothetical protein